VDASSTRKEKKRKSAQGAWPALCASRVEEKVVHSLGILSIATAYSGNYAAAGCGRTVLQIPRQAQAADNFSEYDGRGPLDMRITATEGNKKTIRPGRCRQVHNQVESIYQQHRRGVLPITAITLLVFGIVVINIMLGALPNNFESWTAQGH